jgi:hypothetical protein
MAESEGATQPDLPQAHVAHSVSGRTRLLVPVRRGEGAFLHALAERIAALPEIEAAVAHPRTGSLVVHHAMPLAVLTARLREAGLLAVVPIPAPAAAPPRARRPVASPSPLILVAGGMVGLGVVQAARGRLMGNAVETLWNAFQSRRRADHPAVAATLAAVGLLQLARGQVLGSAVSLFFYALTARRMAQEGAAKRTI